MTASISIFLIGLSIWGVKFILIATGKKHLLYGLLFPVTGAAAGVLISFWTGKSLMPPLEFPWHFMALMGAFAGLLLYLAFRFDFFFKPGIEYLITLILGAGMGVINYFLLIIHLKSLQLDHWIQPYNQRLWLSMLMMGFVLVLGYAFPERLLKRRQKE